MPKNVEIEIWRPVVGFEDYYEVSTAGRVRSFERVVCSKGGAPSTRAAKLLKPGVSSRFGHMQVRLYGENRNEFHYISELVLTAFVSDRPDGHQATHYPDRNPSNNKLQNLRWATPLQNMNDRREHGNNPIGSKNSQSKLHETDVRDIRRELSLGSTPAELMCKYNIAKSTVSDIKRGRSWGYA